MREGTRSALLEGSLDEEIVDRATAAASEAAPDERVRAGLEAAIAVAERDPAAARSMLHRLRGNADALEELEAWLPASSERSTFGLGAAIQVAEAELASSLPDLESRVPELLRWLEGDW